MQPLFTPVASCYILYSQRIQSYYVGSTTESVDVRLSRHNLDYYENKWTSKGIPWVLYLEIPCDSIQLARAIEFHIKRMKSKIYIQNLSKYPEMVTKLKYKYQMPDC